MANFTPDDQLRAKRSEDPALAVASKRIVALEADINNLRKGMVQQLTVSGKLLKAVFALDNDYFGSRFQNQHQQQNKDSIDPFRDLTIATQVVEAVSEELQGASAFADSPVFRDGIANLITALESSRGVAMEMEKAGIIAVGLPVKPEALKTRSFPENNPPACLAEAAGSVHDLAALMGRTRDRFSAMRMMMNEAERARTEAEDSVTPVNVDKIAAAVSDELKAVQADLKTTRAQLMSTLDSHAATVKGLRSELERARREAAVETESRRSDRAEARSLAAEIARQIGEAMPAGDSDDLEITLSVLREALSEDHDIAAVAAATEGVVVDWVRLTSARVKKLSEELAASGRPASAADPAGQARSDEAKTRDEEIRRLNEALRAAETRAKQAEAVAREVDALKANQSNQSSGEATALRNQLADATKSALARDEELKRLKEAAAQSGRSKTDADLAVQAKLQQAEAAVKELEATRVRLAEASKSIQARDDEVKRLKDEAAATAAKSQDTAKSQSQAEAVGRDIAALRAQLAQATTALRLKEDEAKRLREAQLQEQNQHTDAAQVLTRQVNAQQEKLAVTTSELQAARAQQGELGKQVAELTRQLAEVNSKAGQGRDAELKQARELHARELKARDDARQQAEARVQQAEAAAKEREAARAAELAETRKSLAAAETKVREAVSRADTSLAEITRMKGEIGRLTAENTKVAASLEYTTARERQLGAERDRLERERAELQARLDALRKASEAANGQAEQSQGTLKRLLAEAKAAESEVKSQVVRLATESASLGERNGQLEKDLAAVRVERERAAAAVKDLTQERDQARMKLAEIERDRARLAETGGKTESQVRNLAQEIERLRQAEVAANGQAERLGAELAQVREKLAAALAGREQSSAQQSAWQQAEAKLVAERDSARAAATAAGSERDRFKANLDRVKIDHEALARRLEERESQLTARLTEVSRQLGELKQTNSRLAADGERLQAELARAGGSKSEAIRSDAKEALERKESTSNWTKRLSDSAAAADQARARASELERRIEEQRHQLAQFEERLARQSQGEVHLRERVAEIERRESALQQSHAAAKAEAAQARTHLAQLERELAAEKTRLQEAEASKNRQRQRFESLMREARDAVTAAKLRQEQTDTDDRAIIADLMKQVQDLRLRTGTRA